MTSSFLHVTTSSGHSAGLQKRFLRDQIVVWRVGWLFPFSDKARHFPKVRRIGGTGRLRQWNELLTRFVRSGCFFQVDHQAQRRVRLHERDAIGPDDFQTPVPPPIRLKGGDGNLDQRFLILKYRQCVVGEAVLNWRFVTEKTGELVRLSEQSKCPIHKVASLGEEHPAAKAR